MAARQERVPPGYWKNLENGVGAMAGLIDFLGGRYPTHEEAEEHLGGLVHVISKKDGPYVGWKNFKKSMGYFSGDIQENLPLGYWKDVDNGMAAMAGLIDYLGNRYPTNNEAEERLRGLVAMIYKKDGPYGGWHEFKEAMGYDDGRIPKGYWDDIGNGVAAMASLIDLLGDRYPTSFEAKKYLPGLQHKIEKKTSQYGGWWEFKEAMGYGDDDNRRSTPKISKGYWEDTDNGMGAMAGLIDFLDGKYPTHDESEIYFSGLTKIISKKGGPYGGWHKFKETMGYEDEKVPKKYWKDIDNGMGAMAGLIDFLGRYPKSEETKEHLSGLLHVINSGKTGPYGGWWEFKEAMGYGDGGLEKGYWNDTGNGMAALYGLIDFLEDRYPTNKEFLEYLPGLVGAVSKKDSPYGGFIKLKKMMGYEYDRLEHGYWKHRDNGIAAMASLIDFLGRYPTKTEAKKNLPGLFATIEGKNGPYGNWLDLQNFMGYPNPGQRERTENGIWSNIDHRISAIQGLIEFLGRYPSIKDATKMNLSGLVKAVQTKDGSWNKFREIMGYLEKSPVENLPRGYWNDTDNGVAAMTSLIDLIGGKYPTQSETIEYLPGLQKAIKKKNSPYGNWEKFKETMDYLDKNPVEKLLFDMKTDDMKTLVSKLGLDRGTMWDILAVKYGVDRNKIIELFKSEPSLGSYMGDFVTGINGIEDWDYIAERTLPYDDGSGTIRKILEKSLFDSVVARLGSSPDMRLVDEELEKLMPDVDKKIDIARKITKYRGG